MSEIEEMVAAAQAPETFDFAAVVQGRGYPKDEVHIHLDEATAYKIQRLEEKINAEDDGNKINALEAEIESLRAELARSRYTFKLTGISTERQEELLAKAKSDFPVEYERQKNPFTQTMVQIEKPNPEQDAKRDRYFTHLLWQAHIEQIVSPTGAVDTAPSLETIESLRKMPTAQIKKLVRAIDKMQVAADAFETATDEDFLAKS